VWCPVSLLPSQGVRWEAVDDAAALATISVGQATVSLEFHFGADGLVESVYTPERSREVGGGFEGTPWQGRFWDYEERDGMRIPMRGEVEWLLPTGSQPYWRGRLTEVVFR